MNASSALAGGRRRRRVADDKRKRAARACDRCKVRKSKCIETAPGRCQRCLNNNLSCRFEREASPDPGQDDNDEYPELLSGVPQNGINGHEVTPQSHATDDSISINSHQTDRVMWPRFLSRLREAFSLDQRTTPEAQDMVAMQAHIAGPRTLQPADLRRLRQAVDVFPPRSVADFLISVCIRHGTDIFFYFDQGQLLADVHEFYTDPQSPLRADTGFVGLALAVFALGSQWTTLVKPDESSDGVAQHVEGRDPGKIFHDQLVALVPDLIERSCVRSIQVPFIMGVYLMPTSAVGSSYVYIGLAVRKALAYDLHKNTDDPVVDDREREVRRRLWWSIYSLERLTSIKLNRARAIDIDASTLPLPSPLPALDQGQIFDNVQHQIAFARLVRILDRVSDLGGSPGEQIDANAVSRIEANLKEWKRSLPPEFRLDSIDPRDSRYRAVFHLYLDYYYAWIAMGKVSVVTVVRSHLRHHFGREPQPLNIDPAVRDLSSSCVKAASKIIRLFETLANTGRVTRFSFTDFQGCSIATIVTLLSGILERDSGYESRTRFGIDCLRKMAAGNMTAKVGVRFVEALQSIADEAMEKLRQNDNVHASSSVTAQTATVASDYTRWAQWLSKAEQAHQSGTSTPSVVLPPTDIPGPASQTHPMPSVTPTSGSRETESWQCGADGQILGTMASPGASSPFARAGTAFPDYMYSADETFAPSFHTDDQNFLMGLTGLDVLDFSELATSL